MLDLALPVVALQLDLGTLFGRTAPLIVDLGCGDGSFLCALAAQAPEKNFLGIERLAGRVERTRRKAPANARVLQVESAYAVGSLLPANSVETFYLLFPDPWPKRRHHRRRIFSYDFLNAIAVALANNGTLHIATDHLNYFQHIEKVARSHPQFEIGDSSRNQLPVTKFERRFQEQGITIHRLELRKISPVT